MNSGRPQIWITSCTYSRFAPRSRAMWKRGASVMIRHWNLNPVYLQVASWVEQGVYEAEDEVVLLQEAGNSWPTLIAGSRVHVREETSRRVDTDRRCDGDGRMDAYQPLIIARASAWSRHRPGRFRHDQRRSPHPGRDPGLGRAPSDIYYTS